MILYQLILKLYNWAVFLAAKTGNTKALALINYRALSIDFSKRSNTVWIHAASAGEGNQAIPLAKAMKKKSNCWIVISFFSPSGYHFHKNTEYFDQVIMLPADFKKNANSLIEKLNPTLAIFIKKEFWWNYLSVLKQKNIPIFLVNAAPEILNPNNIFLQYYDRKCLRLFTEIFLTATPINNSIKLHTISNIFGNTKFESAFSINRSIEINKIEHFTNDHFTIIIGSSWPKEEAFLKNWLSSNLDKPIKVILAPHNISTARIKQLENSFKDSILYSRLDEKSNAKVLILNEIGLLKDAYKYADIAIIGGGFGKGIHNILEAIAFKLPTFFGPNYSSFEEAIELLKHNLAFTFSNQNEFDSLLNNWVYSDEKIKNLKDLLSDYMEEKSNISENIVSELIKNTTMQTLPPK